MAVPDFQSYMTPILHFLSQHQEQHLNVVREAMTEYFQLTDDDLHEILPSGKQTKHYNRVNWALTYMKQAGLLSSPRRGFYKITPLGQEVVSSNSHVNTAFLRQFESFVQFQLASNSSNTTDQRRQIDVQPSDTTPDELLERGYSELQDTLAAELLDRLKQVSPAFFEQVVIDLLLAMGYGGSQPEAAQRVGQSGDGGIDGIINEDRLGLDVVYIQAKRWESNVGARDIRDFAGGLEERRASKGIFITTSDFTRDASEVVTRIGKRVVLINGTRLAQLMIEFNVGVVPRKTYTVKRMDEDYFSEQ